MRFTNLAKDVKQAPISSHKNQHEDVTVESMSKHEEVISFLSDDDEDPGDVDNQDASDEDDTLFTDAETAAAVSGRSAIDKNATNPKELWQSSSESENEGGDEDGGMTKQQRRAEKELADIERATQESLKRHRERYGNNTPGGRDNDEEHSGDEDEEDRGGTGRGETPRGRARGRKSNTRTSTRQSAGSRSNNKN
jgi:hypothetical protein